MKTYYTVKYTSVGALSTDTKVFRTKEEAESFAAYDYRDKPVAHRVSRPETIEKYEKLIEMQEADDAFYNR